MSKIDKIDLLLDFFLIFHNNDYTFNCLFFLYL